MKNMFIAGVIMSLSSALMAQPELTGSPEQLRGFLHPNPTTVNITGNGEITAYNDIAKVSLLFTTEDRQLGEAMEKNQQLRNKLQAQFLAAGIPEESIKSSKFSTSPQFGLFGKNPNSFEVLNRLEISVSESTHLQLLAEAADANKEVEFENIEFEHSQKKEFEERVRDQALQDALDQKEYYESKLELDLKAINFYYGGIRRQPQPLIRNMAVTASRARSETDSLALSSSKVEGGAIAPAFDEIKYTTSITVVYQVDNPKTDN